MRSGVFVFLLLLALTLTLGCSSPEERSGCERWSNEGVVFMCKLRTFFTP